MDPMANRVNVWKYVKGLTIETNNFAFEVKAILGFESTCPDNYGAKIRINNPMNNRVKVWKYIQGLTIETTNLYFEVKVILGLESTCPPR